MRVGVLQFQPERARKNVNFEKVESLCRGLKSDLLVMPELAFTGYLFSSRSELAGLAEPFPGGETSDFLTRLARNIAGLVVAGVAEKDGDALYNAAVLFGPGGHLGTFRKVHLFNTEKGLFQPGNLGFPVFEVDGIKVGMMVCFDWIFPESARSLALAGAQVIAHPANLVLPYCPQAAVTRALENHVFYLLADRTGRETLDSESLAFIGQSRILGVRGEVLASLDREEQVILTTIEPAKADDKSITPRNDLFDDRRPSCYLR